MRGLALAKGVTNTEVFKKSSYYDLSIELQTVSRIIASLKSYASPTFQQAIWINHLYTELLIFKELIKNEIDRRAELIPSGVLLRDLPLLENNIKLASYEYKHI